VSNLVSLFGIVPEDWKIDKIGDIFTLSQGLQISSTKRIQEKKDNYIPLLKITDLPHRKFSEFVTKIEPQYIASVNDIIYTRTGNVGLVYTDVEGCVHNNCFKVNFERDLFDKYYVYYYLKSKQVFIYSNQVATGSVQKDLTHPSFKSCIFAYPTLSEQNKIGIIIKNFDDKIELNNQMNQTLEDMATALFKEWFENFNFPNDEGKAYKENSGEFKSSELGEIPVGWEVKRLFETDIVIEDGDRGKNYPNNSQLFHKGFCPFLNNKNIIGDYINFDKTDFITEKKFNAMGKGIVSVDDIVLTTRGSIGNVGLFHKNLPFRFSRINSGMVIIKNNEDFTCNYLYTLFKSKEMKNQFMSISSGSVQKQLPIRDLKNLVLLKPLKNIQNKFEDIISPIFEQIQQNQQQNQTLKQQRDTLLPKLMSGEIRV